MDNAEVIKALLEANARLTDQIVELSKALAESRPAQVVHTPVEMVGDRGPMWTPETEEDAMFAFQTGQITKDELQDALKEIGFLNAEITVPSSI